jgi:RND family efflux transporter MFP subunit
MNPTSAQKTAFVWAGRVLRALLALALIGGGAAVAWHWMANPPTTDRRPRQAQSTLVEVIPVKVGNTRVTVRALGTVIPAREVQLAARIGGQVASASPNLVPGGRFLEGEEVLRIDPEDYRIALERAEADVVRARTEVRLEMGQQAVARQEYDLLGLSADSGEKDLMLRGPQLQAREAAVAVAEAAVEKARLDLDRTTVSAPFNAVVQTRQADTGSYVNPGTPLASLAGTDTWWVETEIPADQLRHVTLPGPDGGGGSPARVHHEPAWGAEAFREGRVVRLLPDLEPGGRMARLLVAVDDPLDLASDPGAALPLALGALVRVEIEGEELAGVARVPRTAFREGGQVWVKTREGTLDIRDVTVAWSGDDHVLVSDGLADGEQLVTSSIGAPIAGMALRTKDEKVEGGGPGGGQGRGSGKGGGGQGKAPAP